MKFEEFGLNVAKERIKQNISAYELSLRLGKDASYINKLENGKINVSLKMIIEICNCLQVPIENLFKEN
ncbi:MAG: helix-turn-helix transcriptional regulator [Clostridia bacterium]|nr:helix-turn-helix transcriptional regulator [Clostridia bacterium]